MPIDAMSALVDIAQILGFLSLLAMALLFWWGRKWFASHKDIDALRESTTKDLQELEQRRIERMASLEAQRKEDIAELRAAHKDLREEIHSTLGRMEIEAGRRHDGLTRQMDDVARELRKALERSEKAADVAYEARNQAGTVALEISHLSERLRETLAPLTKLAELPERVARIDERVQLLTSDKVKRERDRIGPHSGGSK